MKHRRMRAAATAFLLGMVLVGGRAAFAAPPSSATAALDPDWPCEQIKIDHMSLATLWGGPPLGEFLAGWQHYPAAAALAQRLAQRRALGA